jgi:hypothetical protein
MFWSSEGIQVIQPVVPRRESVTVIDRTTLEACFD